ncbi:ABC transporter ATP-binding protein [Geminicoccaceae bacterium 1502E]|nr:ABC transporter ATP-binding protein [Geminicoccaceae bacterium 1502E]
MAIALKRREPPAAQGCTAPAAAGIRLEGLAKTFARGSDEVRALEPVDLEIEDGEFVAIVGPSGCGKSTLLRLIAGLLAPSSGRTLIAGKEVRRPQTDLGFVFQKPVLLDWRTVMDNVLFQAEMRDLDPATHRVRAARLLEAVGLGDFAQSFPRQLSGGMQQRASIARALIHDPPLLLMDEPFGALDALTREQMRVDLEELWMASPKTVLFITHSIDEAVLLADRVVVMSPRPGRIEAVIRPELARPRGLEARHAAAFEQAVGEITDIFLAKGVLRRGGAVASLADVAR